MQYIHIVTSREYIHILCFHVLILCRQYLFISMRSKAVDLFPLFWLYQTLSLSGTSKVMLLVYQFAFFLFNSYIFIKWWTINGGYWYSDTTLKSSFKPCTGWKEVSLKRLIQKYKDFFRIQTWSELKVCVRYFFSNFYFFIKW